MVVAGMVLAVLAAPSFATELVIPAFWVTPGAGVAWPPAEFGFGRGDVSDVAPVFGGILGVKLAREWGLEVRGHYLKEDELDNLDILHGEGNLTWFLGPEKRFVPLLTAGAGVVRAEDDDASDDTFAWNAGGGALFRFTDQFGIRIDGRYVSYEVEDGLGEKKLRPHTELFAGLNFGFGGAPKDADGDGVPDRADFCADTPMGARVDLQGCPIDGDKDGVADGLDQCDGTPAGATVDAAGCPSDADMDGVLDGIDKCASTAKGAKVDRSGCPIDTDKDGVADGIDTCDSTPKGCTVNASGCPSDADNDGVCDGLDQCADTAANLRVDARGCPIEVTEKETELLETGMIRLQNVNFDTGKATLKEESFAALDEVGDILLRWPELRIEIGGHTDSQGTDAFNQTLSENRAKSVLDYLQGKFKGLAPGQLSSKGYGEATPIAPNDSALNRAKNRRVEFKVLNTEVLKREKERVKLVPKQ
jgi:outer membrane protein OmpA-like peptidoglycan-associated protein